jgi:hypothetical protein
VKPLFSEIQAIFVFSFNFVKIIVKNLIFPFLVLLCAGKINAQTLTVAEVYDLHVGDELGIIEYRTGAPEYRFMKVIKRTAIGTDSLQLTYYLRTMEPRMQGNIYGEDTLTLSIGRLNSPFFKNYIEGDTTFEKYQDSMKKTWVYTIELWDSTFSDKCGRPVNSRYSSYNAEGTYEEYETLAYKGLGVLKRMYEFYAHTSEYKSYEVLEYYIKDGVLCGNKKAFPLSIRQIEQGSEGMVYPSPSRGFIFISGIPEFSFRIMNLQGMDLMHGNGTENQPISIEHLPAGTYFILIVTANTQTSYKVVTE